MHLQTFLSRSRSEWVLIRLVDFISILYTTNEEQKRPKHKRDEIEIKYGKLQYI